MAEPRGDGARRSVPAEGSTDASPENREFRERLERWRASRASRWARWSEGSKPFTPVLRLSVAEELRQRQLESAIACWICGASLPLRDLPYEVQVGLFTFAFEPLPGYRCEACNETYLPEAVAAAVAGHVEAKLSRLGPSPIRYVNPHRITA